MACYHILAINFAKKRAVFPVENFYVTIML